MMCQFLNNRKSELMNSKSENHGSNSIMLLKTSILKSKYHWFIGYQAKTPKSLIRLHTNLTRYPRNYVWISLSENPI